MEKRERARARQSKPAPQLALVAGTRTVAARGAGAASLMSAGCEARVLELRVRKATRLKIAEHEAAVREGR